MPLDIDRDNSAMVRQFTRHKFGEVCKNYAFPAAVYFGQDMIILWNEEEFHSAVKIYRGVLQEAGLAFVETKVIETSALQGNGSAVSVANKYYDTAGEVFGHSKIRYFLQSVEGSQKIRLVEYQKWPCAEQLAANPAYQALLEQNAQGRVA